MERGELKLIIGNMFANKTGWLIHIIETLREFGKKKVLVLKPTTDTRSGAGQIKDYHGKTMEATEIPVSNPWFILNIIREKENEIGIRFNIIAFDEVQFFPNDSEFFKVVDGLLNLGYDIMAAGLALDFKREPFGSTLILVGLCQNNHNLTWLTSFCVKCGKPAPLPQRIFNGKPAPYDSPQVFVGGKEAYEARCYACHELPDKLMH